MTSGNTREVYLKVPGETKPKGSPFGGNPGKVVERLQSEVPLSSFKLALDWPRVDKKLRG